MSPKSPTSRPVTARSLALTTLLAIERGQYGNIAVDTALRRTPLNPQDRNLYTTLVYGVTERKTTLEYLLSRFSTRPVETLDAEVRLTLCLGLYQLIYLDRVPDHAALDATVDLVPHRVSGYVNAVLRSYLRFEAALPPSPDGTPAPRENALATPADWVARFPDLADDPEGAMSVAYGFPPALCRTFRQALGEPLCGDVLAGFGEKPPVTLRVNPLKTTVAALSDTLMDAGFVPAPGSYAPYALRVADGAVATTEAFAAGAYFVQDEASQICVDLLDARPGQRVVDTCSCPGSKAFGLALDMEDRGEVYAFDLHQSKLSLITKGAERLGISIIRADARDARDPDPALAGRCDRVLCDVPCSGLGVMGKKPEIRHKDLTESQKLPAIQAAILEASAAYLAPGGMLVYSTCTVLPVENQEVVTAFLVAHPDFESVDFEVPSKDRPAIRSQGGMVTLYPHINGTDGFFIARMRRKG